jgi:ribosomal-protein-alanine N-acetyltransferase
MASRARDPGQNQGEATVPDLRPVTSFDLDLLALMHAAGFTESWDRPWSRQSFADILAMPGCFGLLAAIDRAEPAGFGLTLASGEEVELLLLSVLPAWRRQGVGHRLLLGLLDQAYRGGARRALLEVAAPNAAAIALYERAGFTACGRRRNYYAPGIDAVIYERILQPGSIQIKCHEEPGNRCE